MTRILKTSGFLGLTVMMLVGIHQATIIAGGDAVPGWLVGGHAHLGVLSILAIVLGFAIPAIGLSDRLRKTVTGLFVVGQWGLPLTVWTAGGLEIEILHATVFLWGGALIVSMAIMTWQSATAPDGASEVVGTAPADD